MYHRKLLNKDRKYVKILKKTQLLEGQDAVSRRKAHSYQLYLV